MPLVGRPPVGSLSDFTSPAFVRGGGRRYRLDFKSFVLPFFFGIK